MSNTHNTSGTKDLKEGPVNGLVLVGGYSTRMGADKSLLVYHGMPQREFLFQLLKKYCNDVFTSCRRDQQVPSRLNPLYDNPELAGPLKGIMSAFQHDEHSAWLVIAVDMPFVNGPAIEALLQGRDRSKLATCFQDSGSNQPEPLLTIWEPEAYPYLQKFSEGGNISPRDFLKTHPVKMIDPPDAKILINVNHPGFRI